MWPAYLDWQRRLVEVVDKHPLRASLYGLENNERLLTDPVGAEHPLFKDGVHYTAPVGDSVLACLDHQPAVCDEGLRPQLLDAANIEAYLDNLTRTMRSYADSYPREFAALERWLLD